MLGANDSQTESNSLSVLVIHAAVSPAVAHRVVILRVVGAEALVASSSLRVVVGLVVEACKASLTVRKPNLKQKKQMD